MSTSFRDALGQEPKVGDLLFYGQTGRWAEFMIGRVTKLTPKCVKIVKVKGDRYHGKEEILVSSGSHTVVITELSAAQKYADRGEQKS